MVSRHPCSFSTSDRMRPDAPAPTRTGTSVGLHQSTCGSVGSAPLLWPAHGDAVAARGFPGRRPVTGTTSSPDSVGRKVGRVPFSPRAYAAIFNPGNSRHRDARDRCSACRDPSNRDRRRRYRTAVARGSTSIRCFSGHDRHLRPPVDDLEAGRREGRGALGKGPTHARGPRAERRSRTHQLGVAPRRGLEGVGRVEKVLD
jgi:hypothetical protein